MGLLWKVLLNLQLIDAIALCLLSSFSYLDCDEVHDALKQDTQCRPKHASQCIHMQDQGACCVGLCAGPGPCAGEEILRGRSPCCQRQHCSPRSCWPCQCGQPWYWEGRPHLSGEVRQSDGFVGFGCHLGHKELVV